jgi:hypothetical protein
MSTWGSADFRVFADEKGYYPLPERDGDGLKHYRARVRPNSETEYKNLANNVSSDVTFKRARSSDAFMAMVDDGPAAPAKVLVVPVRGGGYGAFLQAILVSCSSPLAHGADATLFECQVDFAILDADITPDADSTSSSHFLAARLIQWGYGVEDDGSVGDPPPIAPNTFLGMRFYQWGYVVYEDLSIA